MPSKYALVQFRPDPSSDERVDIGVVAWDAEGAHVVFIEAWERVQSVSMEEARLLRDFAQALRERLSDGIDVLIDANTGRLIEDPMPGSGLGIRFTPERRSSESAPTLVSSLAARFRYAPPPKAKRGRGHQVAASHARRAIADAVREQLPGAADRLVKAHRVLAGKFGEHQFDVVLGDDEPSAAVAALSFESSSRRNLQRETDALAWALDDVRKSRKRMPLAVFILPPTNAESEIVRQRAAKAFTGIGVEMIADERAIGRWAVSHMSRSAKSPRARAAVGAAAAARA